MPRAKPLKMTPGLRDALEACFGKGCYISETVKGEAWISRNYMRKTETARVIAE